jgi:hypothetical protein
MSHALKIMFAVKGFCYDFFTPPDIPKDLNSSTPKTQEY